MDLNEWLASAPRRIMHVRVHQSESPAGNHESKAKMTVKHQTVDSPGAVYKFGTFMRLYTYPCSDTAVIDLFNACERGDLGQVTALATSGVDVNARVFRFARKPIHVATEKGHAHIVKFLLAQGADKDIRNFDDSSALILAAQNGSADIIRALIEADANVKFTNKFKDTALHIVCNTGRLQPIIERLVEHGADLNQSDARDLPLHIVSRRGYANSVDWIIKHGCAVDAKNSSGRTALHAACARGQTSSVDILVDNGADVTLRTEDDDTSPYILACQYGTAKVVERLLKTGLIDPNEKDNKGESTLFTAYKSKNSDLVKLLYKEYGVPVEGEFTPLHIACMLEDEENMGAFTAEDFKAKDYEEKTALHLAAQKGNMTIVRHCLAMDADPNALDKDSNTALYLTLKNDKFEVANELLGREDAILDQRNNSNNTALDIVCGNGNMDFVEIILDKLTTKYNGTIPSELFTSALHESCSSGHVTVLRTLLRAGAVIQPEQEMEFILSAAENGHTEIMKILSLNGLRINIKDDGLNTPIHKACYCSDELFLKSLIEHDVDINAKNDDGKTVLHLATANGQAQSVSALLKLGANVNETDNNGKTPLHISCGSGRQQVFTTLLQHGADVSVRDASGAQPLHYAAECGNLNIIRTLLRNGADVLSRDQTQRTPLHYCCLKGYIYAACALIEHGADINAQDNLGRTVLHIMCERLFESPYVRRYVKYTDVPCDRTHVELTEILLQAGCDASIRDKDGCLPISVILRRLSGLPEGGGSSRVLFADEVSNALFALLLDAYYPKQDLNSETLAKLFSRVGKPVMLLLMRSGCVSEISPHPALLLRLVKNKDLRSFEELHELGYHVPESVVREAVAGFEHGEELAQEVVQMNKGVLRLKELCRLDIRRIFRRRSGRMTAMVDRLPIPIQLKDFVVMHYF